MFVRIVKLRFHEENIIPFLENFEEVKDEIRGFNGNQFLELYQDKNDKRTFFTYSYWESESHLEAYRNSDLFKGVWSYPKLYLAINPKLGA